MSRPLACGHGYMVTITKVSVWHLSCSACGYVWGKIMQCGMRCILFFFYCGDCELEFKVGGEKKEMLLYRVYKRRDPDNGTLVSRRCNDGWPSKANFHLDVSKLTKLLFSKRMVLAQSSVKLSHAVASLFFVFLLQLTKAWQNVNFGNGKTKWSKYSSS